MSSSAGGHDGHMDMALPVWTGEGTVALQTMSPLTGNTGHPVEQSKWKCSPWKLGVIRTAEPQELSGSDRRVCGHLCMLLVVDWLLQVFWSEEAWSTRV